MRKLNLFGFSMILYFIFAGCAAKNFEPVYDLNEKLKGGTLAKKFDNFMIILDSSGSMKDDMGGIRKTDYTKNLLRRMNTMIPNLDMMGALRTFGYSVSISEKGTTDLVYWPVRYSKPRFEDSIDMIKWASGKSSLDVALEKATQDLLPLKGKSAVILFSDGKLDLEKSISAAQKMKKQLGDRICFYSIHIESNATDIKQNEIDGRVMNEIAAIGRCGIAASSKNLETDRELSLFVENLFFEKDSDLDGIADSSDFCPNTPKATAIDEKGCPLDSDGDGIREAIDQCRDTPKGIAVDDKGCPIDTDRDGVFDYIDKCPDTPSSQPVDTTGCSPETAKQQPIPDTPVPAKAEETPKESVAATPVEEPKPAEPKSPSETDSSTTYQPEIYFSKRKFANEKIPPEQIFDAILFSYGNPVHHPKTYPRLDLIIEVLKFSPEISLKIIGHTDNIESESNRSLSLQRAESIASYLIYKGIDPKRVKVEGMGAEKPRNSNISPVGQADNRRVEFELAD